MPTIKDAQKGGFINYVAADVAAKSSPPGWAPNANHLLTNARSIGSLPLVLGTTGDAFRQFRNPSLPQSRIMTMPPAASASQNAAASSQTITQITQVVQSTTLPFDKITTGINILAAMDVGSGATLFASGTGVIDATEINGIPITGSLTHAGMIPISQPGNTQAVWADPLVQGIQAEGTAAATVNPVLIAAKDTGGDLADLLVDAGGNLLVTISNPFGGVVTEADLDATIVAAGTTAPAKLLFTGGKTNDGTPQYQLIPLGAGGRSVIIEGFSGGTAVPVSNTYLDTALSTLDTDIKTNIVLAAGSHIIGKVSQDTSPWVISGTVTSSGTATVAQGTAATATAPWYVVPGNPTTSQLSQAVISFSGSGATIIVAGTGGETVRIFRIFFVNSNATTATNITIQDTTPTSFSGAFLLNSGGMFSADGQGDPLFVSATGKGIQLNSSAAVQISGVVWYTKS